MMESSKIESLALKLVYFRWRCHRPSYFKLLERDLKLARKTVQGLFGPVEHFPYHSKK